MLNTLRKFENCGREKSLEFVDLIKSFAQSRVDVLYTFPSTSRTARKSAKKMKHDRKNYGNNNLKS